MINIDTSDRGEQRKFGVVMAVAIAILGLIRWAFHGFAGFPTYFFGVAAVFLALGLVWPPALKPVFIAWIKFAEVLNFLVTRLFLAVVFYGMITPVRICIRLFGEDPLKRAWRKPDASYWEAPDRQPEKLEDYKNQF